MSFISYYKRQVFIKKFYVKRGLETGSKPFCVFEELNYTETNFFESSGLYWICNSKTIKILKYLTVKILFYKELFKNKKGPGTSF